jgi:restriction system protein
VARPDFPATGEVLLFAVDTGRQRSLSAVSNPAWRQYQEDAAEFLRELGFDATTDVELQGVRNKHAVDVVATAKRYGVTQLWIVECKLWARPVGNDRVAVLAATVADVGAGQGLLSESGFQAGAVRRASQSNITLSSLSDMRANAADEAAQLAMNAALGRIVKLEERLLALTLGEDVKGGRRVQAVPGADMFTLTPLLGRLSMAQSGLLRALGDSFPAVIQASWAGQGRMFAMTRTEAGEQALVVADDIESELVEQERRAAVVADREADRE